MIFKALFGNNPKEQAPQQPQPPPFKFSPNDPIFQAAPLVSSQEIILNSRENSPLSKLVAWFNEHTNTSDFVSFRKLTPEKTPQFNQIKTISAKTQVLKGLDLIFRQEKAIAGPQPIQSQPTERPFPNLIGLREANRLWQKVKINDLFIEEINSQLNIIIIERLRELKIIAASIVSLLTSVDAYPNEYIPIINYQGIDLNNEMITNKDDHGRILQQRIVTLQQMNMKSYKLMNEIEDRYGSENEDLQGPIFVSLLESFLPFLDKKGHFLACDLDEVPFIDFLNHPNSKALSVFQNYREKCEQKSIVKLIENLIVVFSIQDPQLQMVLVALCCYSMAPFHFPQLEYIQNSMEPNLEFSIPFFLETDPIKFLDTVYQESQSQDLETVITRIIEGLSGFARNWVDLLRYVVYFTIPEFLPTHLSDIRSRLAQTVKLYQ